MSIESEFIRGLVSVEPTLEDIGDLPEEQTSVTLLNGDATPEDPKIRVLKRQRERRIRERTIRQSLGTDHREQERDHRKTWWRLPVLANRRSAIDQRTVREAFASVEEPFVPNSLTGQSETAQPTKPPFV